MSERTWASRGLVATRLMAAAGVVSMAAMTAQGTAWAVKGSTHKGGAGQQTGGSTSTTTTTVASTTTTVASTTSTTSSTTTTTMAPPPPADTTPPAVSISSPGGGSTVAGTVSVSGAASDNVSVSSVQVSVDNASWQTATGTTSWSWWWSTSGISNGSHTLSVRATDSSGNVSPVVTETVTVSNSTSSAPATQGTWVSPEGVTIEVNSTGTNPHTGKSWTIADVYNMLTSLTVANSTVRSGFLALAPSYTVDLQDTYGTQNATGCSSSSTGTKYSAVTYLLGAQGAFASTPDAILGHEYGGTWTQYFLCVKHQQSLSAYLNERWVTADGSDTLATDPNTGTSFAWDPLELMADDYRLLFGSSAAVNQMPYYWNSQVVDPRSESGLAGWFLQQWA